MKQFLKRSPLHSCAILCVFACLCFGVSAQQLQNSPQAATPGTTAPSDYVIGVEDTLGVLIWREDGMSADVVVRPDGKISLPLIQEVQAAGLTPSELRATLQELARRFVAEPNVSVVVRQINSRKVFITGQVARPGAYQLITPTTVLQLIALAGGLTEFADPKGITIIRPGEPSPLKFNYDDVRRGKKLHQNTQLKVGDTVVVP